MLVVLQTYDRGDEKKKLRAAYQTQVQRRLKAMEKDVESSVPVIIKQVMAPHSDACIIS